MSMPAATPAEVTTTSSTQRFSRSTVTFPTTDLLEQVERGPMGGGPAAVEQAGAGEQQRAGADRGDQLGPGRGGADPVEHRGVFEQRPGAEAAGDQQEVDRRSGPEIVFGHHLKAAGGAQDAGLGGDGEDPEGSRIVAAARVGAGDEPGAREDLEGPAKSSTSTFSKMRIATLRVGMGKVYPKASARALGKGEGRAVRGPALSASRGPLSWCRRRYRQRW